MYLRTSLVPGMKVKFMFCSKIVPLKPSSPPRHSAEFFNLVEEKAVRNPIVFMYTDGGHVYQCQAYKT